MKLRAIAKKQGKQFNQLLKKGKSNIEFKVKEPMI